MKTARAADFFLSRFAEGEWREVVRPWLEAAHGSLTRSLVVVPTRGQAQALKQRCLEENVALLGVEFLTPGLARQKRGAPEGLPRSLQLLILRDGIERRLAGLPPEDPSAGLWRSLGSDLETALADFDDLLRAGFQAADFPRPELRELFGELAERTAACGYALAAREDLVEAQAPVAPGRPAIADRLLVLGGGPENWPHFFAWRALCGRCGAATVALAEPDFGGSERAGEQWVEAWQRSLRVGYQVVVADPDRSAEGVAALWRGGGGSAELADVRVGAAGADEMEHVRDLIVERLAAGATTLAVVFPRADAAHARLLALLEEAGIGYADLVGTAGTPPVDLRVQVALVDFYERGGRLEELLALWPLLGTLGLTRTTPGAARRAGQELFDAVQSHRVAPHTERLEAADGEAARELGRVARLLLPAWPERLTLADALGRFDRARQALGQLAEPPGWAALREFARRAPEPMSTRALLAALRDFLPTKAPAARAPGRSVFARVTLTTARRAVGVAWSDCILAEANAGRWPERRVASVWLGDDARRALVASAGRLELSLPTSEDRGALDRRIYAALARDTRGRVAFTAALFQEEDPETRLGPNAWLERVLWARGLLPDPAEGIPAFETLASQKVAAEPGPEPPGIEAWHAAWRGRRDPARPFDEHSLCDPSGLTRPARLSASQIQAGVRDPAHLWFEAVLGVRRVEWRPFARAPRQAAGSLVHGLLARALRGTPAEGHFRQQPAAAEAAAALEDGLTQLRAQWPADRYWESFHLGVARAARQLLRRVFALPPAPFSAVEERMPAGATVPVGAAGRIEVIGRMDLVRSDHPYWAGAAVQIVDFKTGQDEGLAADKMAKKGASLQLGVYLEAARSLGARGAVWMLRPEDETTQIEMDALDAALAKLRVVGTFLATGRYGALTPDRAEHSHGFEWPLACAPIAEAILAAKYAATFDAAPEAPDEEEEGDA